MTPLFKNELKEEKQRFKEEIIQQQKEMKIKLVELRKKNEEKNNIIKIKATLRSNQK